MQTSQKGQVQQQEVEVVEFEEDGELIQMEIDDGGGAAAEFATDDEYEEGLIETDSENEDETMTSNDQELTENDSSDLEVAVRSRVVDVRKVV